MSDRTERDKKILRNEAILAKFNNEQNKAINTTDGVIKVIAGPGSGKTEVIAARFVHIVRELNIAPEEILCLTFSRAAAEEMRNRIFVVLNINSDTLNIFDFHAFCRRFLIDEIEKHSNVYNSSFVVSDKKSQVESVLKIEREQGLFDNSADIQEKLRLIEEYKIGNSEEVCEYILGNKTDLPDTDNKIGAVTKALLNEQRKNNQLAFSDLILLTVHILQNDEPAREKWQNKYKYIMVDEFQDVDKLQNSLVLILCEKRKNIMVVGDPNQNIYEWRGSDPDIFFNLLPENSEIIPLTLNYRSTPQIVECANSLISKNTCRTDYQMKAVSESGNDVAYAHFIDSDLSAEYIISEIKRLRESGYDYSDFAVLYRNSRFSEKYKPAFKKGKIPVVVLNEQNFVLKEKDMNSVSLMTIHAAKGKQFKCVFVVGFSDGVIPSRLTIEECGSEGIESERRLVYVALTRAETNLYFISAEDDDGYDPWCESRFLSELGLFDS